MKSILFIMSSLEIGGAERILCDILNKIDYSKYDVDLLLCTRTGQLLECLNSKIHLISIHEPKICILRRVYRKLIFSLGMGDKYEYAMANRVCKSRYDTIVSFCQGPAHKLHSLIVDKSFNNVSWIHSDLSVSNWGLKYFDNDLSKQEDAYNMMNRLVFVSKDARLKFNTLFNIRENIKQDVIYNFVDKQSIVKKSNDGCPEKKKGFLFVSVGRLVQAKRFDRLIDAAKELKNRDYDFSIWIVGGGPLYQELEDRIRSNEVDNIVSLLGLKGNPYPYLGKADCFVLSSQQEGFSIVIAEAFALSKPVISTRVTGPSEILQDGEYGVLVDEDIIEITNAMEKMMIDSQIRKDYSERGQKRLLDFNPEQIMEKIYSVI